MPKEFNFRGPPAALRVMARFAGFDVLNLANNHAGDYGTAALLDTVKYVRRFGMTPVGAGGSLESAAEPRVVERLGLRIAFVGFSNILPSSFFAGPGRAGTQPATPGPDRRRRAPRQAQGRRGDRHLPLGHRTSDHRGRAPASLRRHRTQGAGPTR